VGTGHEPWSDLETTARVSEQAIIGMLGAINQALPSLELNRADVLRVMPGLLPAERPNTTDLVTHEMIYPHYRHGGPARLVSIGSIKYTTSPFAATQALRKLFGPAQQVGHSPRPPGAATDVAFSDPGAITRASTHALREAVQYLMDYEAAQTLDDVVFRRTEWGLHPQSVDLLQARLMSSGSSLRVSPGHG
jgi:glycerol-3-phosphate dehydrogenase